MFVDDVVMLGEGTWENLKEVEKILDLYKKAIDMHINMEKSILSEMVYYKLLKRGLGLYPFRF